MAVMTSEASLKSGYHEDHQEMFLCVCEGQQCWNPEHGDGNSFGQEGAPLLLGEGGRRQGRGSHEDEWSLEEECLMTLIFQVMQEMRSSAYTRGLLEVVKKWVGMYKSEATVENKMLFPQIIKTRIIM